MAGKTGKNKQFIIVCEEIYRITTTYYINRNDCGVAIGEENFFFLYFSHHIIVKSSKCQPRCNITIYWKGIDLLGYGGDDILFSSTKNNDTFTSNQIYLSLVYINELHLKHKMKHNFRIAASFIFCTNVSYGFSP